MPVIFANGNGRTEWGATTACFTSRFKARNDARINLALAAARACPNGYTVTAGPTYTLTLDCDHQWNGWWPDVNSTYAATATIQCNNTGVFQQFAYADGQSARQDTVQVVSAYKEHYGAVLAVLDELMPLNSRESISAYMERINDQQALAAFNDALSRNRVGMVVVPERRTFLTSPVAGEQLTAIVEDAGLCMLDAFVIQLSQPVSTVAPCSGSSDAPGGSQLLSDACSGRTVRLNINL